MWISIILLGTANVDMVDFLKIFNFFGFFYIYILFFHFFFFFSFFLRQLPGFGAGWQSAKANNWGGLPTPDAPTSSEARPCQDLVRGYLASSLCKIQRGRALKLARSPLATLPMGSEGNPHWLSPLSGRQPSSRPGDQHWKKGKNKERKEKERKI